MLRAAHLDELPQLLNVISGDMSIVGPRPIRPAFFEQLCEEIPQYWQRLVVAPGMTGFAQLRMTREMTWAEKLAHDLEYIADRSPRLYLGVIARDRRGSLTSPRRARAADLAMCGICGLVAAAAAAPTPTSLAAMSATLVHRGPDDDGHVVEGPVALAARRLSIIDLAGGHQPIANEDGRVHVVQNGEIYNHASCARELEARGHRFRDALRHGGDRAPLRGARRRRSPSGCAACSRSRSGTARERRLVLARDRFGIKPLFYWERRTAGWRSRPS